MQVGGRCDVARRRLAGWLGAVPAPLGGETPPGQPAGRWRAAASFLLLALAFACRTAPPPVHYTDVPFDPFPGMDGPNLQLTAQELRGRILWNLWSGDNGGFWNYISQNGFGTSDLLKTIDSRRRATRFATMGLINQPGFQRAAAPDRYGLFLDVAKPGDPDAARDAQTDVATYARPSVVRRLRVS